MQNERKQRINYLLNVLKQSSEEMGRPSIKNTMLLKGQMLPSILSIVGIIEEILDEIEEIEEKHEKRENTARKIDDIDTKDVDDTN